MNHSRFAVLPSILLLSGCAFFNIPSPEPELSPAPDAWRLVWADEFDKNGAPDPTKWGYEMGFVRNREAQYYTVKRSKNARVENGYLVIEGREEKYRNPRYVPNSKDWRKKREFAEYTSASLITLEKASWKYGRIEVSAKLPAGKGTWPAIWMMGANRSKIHWPRCGEIDIMEFVGKKPFNVHANLHYADKKGKHKSKGRGLTLKKSPADGFHVYAIEWNENRMDFFFDSKKYHSVNLDSVEKGQENPFRKPQYLILNLALGGCGGGPLDDSKAPWKFLVDYVRVYKRAD